MASDGSASAFESVPRAWFEPVVGLWVTLLAVLGTHLALVTGTRLLGPLGTAPWAAILVTIATAAVAYGVFGFGVTHAYRVYRDDLPEYVLEPLDREERRWVGSLGVAGVIAMVLGGAWSTVLGHPTELVATLIAIGPVPFPDGITGMGLGLTGVNEIVNGAPVVLFTALLGGILLGPAAAALFHGVLQDTVASIGSTSVSVIATAIVAAALVETSAVGGYTSLHEALNAVVVFGFVLGAAYAYRETGNLLVPMAAYGVFDVLAALLGWLSILASLYAKGHLFG